MTPEEFIAVLVAALIILFVVTVGYHQYKKGQRKEQQPEEMPTAKGAKN